MSGVPRTAPNYHHHRQCWVTASCPGFPDAGLRRKVSLQSYPVIQAALLGYLWWLDGLSWLHGSGLDSKFGLQLPHLVGRRPYPDRLDSDAMPWLPGAGLCETLGRTVPPATNTPARGRSPRAKPRPSAPAGRLIKVSMPSCLGDDVMPCCPRKTVPFPLPRRLIDPTPRFPLFFPFKFNPRRLQLLLPISSSPAHDPRTEQTVSQQQQAKLLLRDIFVRLFLLPQILQFLDRRTIVDALS